MNEESFIFNIVSNLDMDQKTLFEVGAHVGGSIKKYAEQGWEIHAFEPDPKNREKLKAWSNQYQNVHVNAEAVSETNQKNATFYFSAESTGISSLSSFHETHTEGTSVDVITLRDYCASKHIKHISLLKIDAEGHDLFVLKGFPWESMMPEVIVTEFEDRKTKPLGYTYHDQAKLLIDMGYKVVVSEWQPIIKYGIQHNWERLCYYPCDLKNINGWGNFFAFRKDTDESVILESLSKMLVTQEKMINVRDEAILVKKQQLQTKDIQIGNRDKAIEAKKEEVLKLNTLLSNRDDIINHKSITTIFQKASDKVKNHLKSLKRS